MINGRDSRVTGSYGDGFTAQNFKAHLFFLYTFQAITFHFALLP